MAKDKKQIKGSNDIWLLILFYCVILVVILALASCSPQRKLYTLEQKHPELLMQFCDSKAITDTVIIAGKVQVDTQTVTLNCDTVFQNDTVRWKVVKKIPIYSHLTDTFLVSRIDTAGISVLRHENSRITEANNTLKGKLSTWQFWAILGYIIAIVLAVVIGIFVRVK